MSLLHNLLEKQKAACASDLHLYVGLKPHLRSITGDLLPLEEEEIMTEYQIETLAKELLSERQYETLKKENDFDLSMTFEGHGRFRATFFFDLKGIAIVFRFIPENIYSLEKLGLPVALKNLAQENHGFILITGPNGSGKTTTLASFVDEINNTRNANIITVEDPIEYVHKSNKSVISQREVGTHVSEFNKAAKHMFRQDVNVVMIGELRDYESFSLALDVAETGHLVITTMHAESTTAALARVIGMFPNDQQNLIRTKLALSLKGIVSQKLIPTIDKTGRALASELLIPDEIVKKLIIAEDISHIRPILDNRNFDDLDTIYSFHFSLIDLYARGLISREQAILNAENREEFAEILKKYEHDRV